MGSGKFRWLLGMEGNASGVLVSDILAIVEAD